MICEGRAAGCSASFLSAGLPALWPVLLAGKGRGAEKEAADLLRRVALPALKTADVGVAMGAMGSDIAVEAADVALMTDDISKVPYLKWLSNTTVKTIKGAITLSMGINLVAVTLSVLGVLTPTTGALVHNAGSCFVVLLAALLYDRRYRP